MDNPAAAPNDKALPTLQVEGLKRDFDVSAPWLNRVLDRLPKQTLKAVDGVDFIIPEGETFSLVGESGCGKSTIARLVVGLYAPSSGRIVFEGNDIGGLTRTQMAPIRRRIQMIFQDPYASLNPRWRVKDIIAEPIRAFSLVEGEAAIENCITQLLEQVKLTLKIYHFSSTV